GVQAGHGPAGPDRREDGRRAQARARRRRQGSRGQHPRLVDRRAIAAGRIPFCLSRFTPTIWRSIFANLCTRISRRARDESCDGCDVVAWRSAHGRPVAAARAPGIRPLPASFSLWLDLSSDNEVRALLVLVKAALTRRGYVVAIAAEKR